MKMSYNKVQRGTRIKIYSDDGLIIKKGEVNYSESKAEVIASKISKQLGFIAVDYWYEDGFALSYNFKEDYSEMTLADIIVHCRDNGIDTYQTKNYNNFAVKLISNMYEFLVGMGLQSDYSVFIQLFIIDAMIVNWDRHLDNIGFLFNKKESDKFYCSPIFDCGNSLNVGELNKEKRKVFDKHLSLQPTNFTLGELERALGVADYFKKIDVEQLKRDVGDRVANSLEMDAFLARYTEFVPKSFSFSGFDNLIDISKKITKGDK